jgi:hypothetical protein
MTKILGYNMHNPFKTVNLTTPQSTTSSTLETKLGSINIPANTFGVGDVLKVSVAIKKTGANGLSSYKLYWNSADSISSPTPLQMLQYTNVVGTTTNPIFFSRRISIVTADGSGDGTFNHLNTDGVYQDYLRIGNYVNTSLAINWTIDSWIIIAGNVANGLDSINCQWIRVTNG